MALPSQYASLPGAKDSLSSSIAAESIPSIVIPSVAVILRFWSRFITKKGNTSRFWWDDWFCFASLPFALAMNISILYGAKNGLGKHVFTLTPDEIRTNLLLLYADYFLWNMGVTLTKLSVLCLYARIFKVVRWFRIALWTVGAIQVAWLIFAMFSATFQCTPIDKAWNPLKPGHCINFYSYFIALAITTLVLDVIVLLLPMPLVVRISMTFTRKILVVLVFMSGYAVIAFSIGRTVAVVKEGPSFAKDITYKIVPIGRWLILENPICILSISLPAIFSLVRRGVQHGPLSLLSSTDYDSLPSMTSGSRTQASKGRNIGTESTTSITQGQKDSMGTHSQECESSTDFEMVVQRPA